jgi:hypothetical protein
MCQIVFLEMPPFCCLAKSVAGGPLNGQHASKKVLHFFSRQGSSARKVGKVVNEIFSESDCQGRIRVRLQSYLCEC